MTKLQTALGFSPEQVAALPPPLVKIRELEQDNARLQKENEDLRRMLSDTGARVSMDVTRRNSLASFNDTRICDRDYKRRKMSGGVDEVYMVIFRVFLVFPGCLMLNHVLIESKRQRRT